MKRAITIREELKMLLARNAVTITKLAKMLKEQKGIDVPVQTLSSRINRRIIKFEEVRDIMDVLGYKIEFTELD
ncbi:MAG: hypothetical protein LBK53_00910 [Heliobacteriaceae bacterium]|jgi:hypothetical protein|nr:hypothetical protein [Heliobacteriaceae bacterium]